MRPAALLLALLPGVAAPEEVRGAAEAGVLAGLWGVSTASEVRLVKAPDDPHRLEIVLAFPDRARWTLRRPSSDDRRLEYRFGEHGFVVPLGSDESIALEGAERQALLRRTRLRQAAFLWPHGARWEGEGRRRSAPLEGVAGHDPQGGLGRLQADLDAEGLPIRIQSLDATGALEETLEVLAWQEVAGRRWPARMRLAYRGEPVWEESVIEVRAGVRLQDRYFVPMDRHEILRPYAAPMRARLGATWTLRRPLGDARGWPEAVAAGRRLLAETETALSGSALLDPMPWIVCDPAGAPVAVEVRLASGPKDPPAGWSRVPDRDALQLVLGGTAPPNEEDRSRLAADVPDDRLAEREWQVGIAEGEIVLVLPLAP